VHHFILPTQDTWISSGSSELTGESLIDGNFGKDEILQINKIFQNSSFEYQTRALVDFGGSDFTSLSESISDGDIPSNAEFYLRLFETEGTSESSEEYSISAFPLYYSWKEGFGKSTDNPKGTFGDSWLNRDNREGATAISWSFRQAVSDAELRAADADGDGIEFNEYHVTFTDAGQAFGSVTGSIWLGGGEGGGGVWINRKGYFASQSFSSEAADVEMNVTDMVNKWLDSSISNYGLILKFSGSQEEDSSTFGNLKFFSRNSNTIFQPKLEIRWDDHIACSGSNTGSLNELTMSGLVDNYLYMKGLKDSYKETEKVKFRVGARKRYLKKSVATSVQSLTNSYITEKSASYAIKDIATDEFIVPFSDYTYLSCDNSGPYFKQWLNGFYSNREYKILLKLKYADGQEQVFDDNFKFSIDGGD
jgi:hypothetical protein